MVERNALEIIKASLIGKIFRNRQGFDAGWSIRFDPGSAYLIEEYNPERVIEVKGINLTTGKKQNLLARSLDKFYPISVKDLTRDERKEYDSQLESCEQSSPSCTQNSLTAPEPFIHPTFPPPGKIPMPPGRAV